MVRIWSQAEGKRVRSIRTNFNLPLPQPKTTLLMSLDQLRYSGYEPCMLRKKRWADKASILSKTPYTSLIHSDAKLKFFFLVYYEAGLILKIDYLDHRHSRRVRLPWGEKLALVQLGDGQLALVRAMDEQGAVVVGGRRGCWGATIGELQELS